MSNAGRTFPAMNWKALAKYEFALPPLEEQRRIVEVLQCVSKKAIFEEAHRHSFESTILRSCTEITIPEQVEG